MLQSWVFRTLSTLVVLIATVYAQDSSGAAAARNSASDAGKKNSAGERVVLKVGAVEVTEKEFEMRVKDIEGDADPDRAASAKNLKRMGDDYASVLMLAQQAEASHLDDSPEIRRKLEIGRLQILSDAEFAKLMEQSKPSQAEITDYYKAHADQFQEVLLRRLFIWKKGPESKNRHGLAPEEARARADAILKASAQGGDTASLLKEFEKSEFGLLDPKVLSFPRVELPPAMEKVAFNNPEGKWYQVHDTPDSILLIDLVKRNRQQLGEVSPTIEDLLQKHKMNVKLKELKKNASIWMDEKYFGAADGAPAGKAEAVPPHQPQ